MAWYKIQTKIKFDQVNSKPNLNHKNHLSRQTYLFYRVYLSLSNWFETNQYFNILYAQLNNLNTLNASMHSEITIFSFKVKNLKLTLSDFLTFHDCCFSYNEFKWGAIQSFNKYKYNLKNKSY